MSKIIKNSDFRAGFVAIIGAPNSGKSSLLNRYLEQKVAIVTPKPQTTRHKILGVLTEKTGQIVFVDTPGIHKSEKLLNVSLMTAAATALTESDLCLWVVDSVRRGEDHDLALDMVGSRGDKKLVIALNKADIAPVASLKELSAQLAESVAPDAVLSVSAKSGKGLKELKKSLINLLPASPALYEEDALTDQSLRDIASEYIREAIFQLTYQEIPYSSAVTIDSFKEPAAKGDLYRIEATIHVERLAQKKVMIGEGGRNLKKIGIMARQGLEEFLESKVFLSLFVRTTKDWSTDEKKLAEFGYKPN
ncbi:MAG: GTPase Era [Deltaproteobacteria bacterium]|jgi:GTP-binding protein Era|nr:GTPase Era [Deltaproteobacteria bacterium]